MTFNRYLVDANPERRDARRLEIKRDLAQRTVNQERIAELQAIVRKLDDDSDRSAEQHSVEASKLQAELLDILDEQHIAAKSLQRKAILTELASLNNELESRCQANELRKQFFEKRINDLLFESYAAETFSATT
ncbi:MAG TPA: hypothetical protein VM260_27905 [Pirellula sp.]|nr:hypothetical protein [Pirellula sp.]